MQVLMIMGIFGAVYAAVIGLTIGMSLTSMQQIEEDRDKVIQLFEDIEYAVNSGYLRNNADLRTVYPVANLNFTREYLKWTNDELANDPWKSGYIIKAYAAPLNSIPVYADNGPDGVVGGGDDSLVNAPVVAFLIASYGSDRQDDGNYAAAVTTYNDIITFDTTGVGDDIVHIFTTRTAMLKTWNETKEFMNEVGSTAAEDYKQQHDKIKDAIVQYYVTNNISLFDVAGNIIQANVGIWRLDAAFLLANPNYPQMTNSISNLGLNADFNKLPASLRSATLTYTHRGDANEIMDVTLTSPNGANVDTWGINYTVTADGSANDL